MLFCEIILITKTKSFALLKQLFFFLILLGFASWDWRNGSVTEMLAMQT